MKISEKFDLQKTQYELDFVDIDTDKDTPLFLDPYFISKMESPFAEEAYRTLRKYFNYLLALLRSNNIREAKEIFSFLRETNEICLGMSSGNPSGKGMGPSDADKIFNSLIQSKAYETGLMEDIEDFRIFVPNVDKDKVSDMTANIIKWHLVEYTQEQCKLWKIPLTNGVPSGYFWNDSKKQWDNQYTDMLVIDGRKIILVPKHIVSFSKEYTHQKYLQHFVLNFLQSEHLRLNTTLVKERNDKTKYVTKKDVKEQEEKQGVIDKKWLAGFTLEHPEVFKAFKKDTINQISSVDNKDIPDNSGIEVTDVTEYLISKLKSIPRGGTNAFEYHSTVVGIIELLFYPRIGNPRVEREIHDGRKRIDISFDNCAETGFFFILGEDIPCRFIMVECKNYSKDIANPELDQLSGRFSPRRGQFGISTCRHIENMKLFMDRCADTWKDNRGLIIPLTDKDFIEMLQEYPRKGVKAGEDILQDRYRDIALR
jgi:hypothetical protein